MNHAPSRRRLAAAVAALTTVGVLAAAPPAEASQYLVQSGDEITVPFGDCTPPQVPAVVPAQAGTAVYNADTTVTFTASADYAGSAVVTFTCTGILAALQLEFVVQLESATADATFTPRPAPGPCITLTLNDTGVVGVPSSVRFGDVIVGESAVSPTDIVVGSCTSIDQGIGAAVSDATTGTGPGQVSWEPNTGTLSPNQFRYELDIVGPVAPTAVDKTQRALATLAPVGLITIDSALSIAPGSTTGVGELFTATLTFLAIEISEPAP